MEKLIAVGLNVVDKYPALGVMYPGGNELNVAVYARWLGAQSAFLGVFGSDGAARSNEEVLRKEGVEISHCRHEQGENGYAIVTLVNGDRVFGEFNDGGVTGRFPIRLTGEDMRYIRGFDVISASINSRLPEREIERLHSAGVPLSYDFSDRYTPGHLRRVAPHVDFGFVSCSGMDWSRTEAFLRELHALGCPVPVATRGSEGALLFDGNSFYRQPAEKAEVVDTMGAGDSFITAFLLEYAAGVKAGLEGEAIYRKALQAGARFAAKICGLQGAIGHPMPLR